nr:ATPase F0 subunit 8 [Ilyograpsus nodulosus]
MPQMAPILWFPMFMFFLSAFFLFLILNYFIKPFNKTENKELIYKPIFKPWSL